ncbi:MAG: OmpA family protein [Terriglobia bacterium]
MRNRTTMLKLCVLLGAIALMAACHAKRVAAPNVPAAPSSAEAPVAPGPPTCTLTVEPATVAMGQSATLTWTSENASDLKLQPKLGTQQAEGSTSVTPTEPTTYTLNLTGPGGSGECSARVTVTPGTPPAPSVEESNLPPGGARATAAAAKLQDAFFDFNQAQLRPEAQAALSQDAKLLKSHQDVKVRISGHCDQRGSEEYNLGLGQRRAEAAEQFLVNLGIPSENISTVSYGKDRLFCTENTEDCYQQNRRAHVEIVNP